MMTALSPELDALSAPVRGCWPSGRVAVALSGGVDSAMLAVVADRCARERNVELLLLHVHHGLLPQANAWAEQVQALARLIDWPVEILQVVVEASTGRGMEASARDARYEALMQACERHGVASLLLAHHQDDQAETVLLRLLRGAGVAGMAAMRAQTARGQVQLLRPWLGVPRARILAFAEGFSQATGWHAVQDPTNVDPRYTRAAVRTRLTPTLNERWPGWQAILGRHARQAQEAATILDEVAQADFATIATVAAESLTGSSSLPEGPTFSLANWRNLSPARQRNVLRYWLSLLGARMPSDARLADLQRQLAQLHGMGHDRNLIFDHGDHRIRCVRGTVLAEPLTTAKKAED